jgi:hypothetical protein
LQVFEAIHVPPDVAMMQVFDWGLGLEESRAISLRFDEIALEEFEVRGLSIAAVDSHPIDVVLPTQSGHPWR